MATQTKEEQRAVAAAYEASPEGRAVRTAYWTSPEGKVARATYNASPKGKAAHKTYHTSPKGKAADKKYKASTKGKARRKLYDANPEVKAAKRARNWIRQGAKLKAIPTRAYRGNTEADRLALQAEHHKAIDGGSCACKKYVTDFYWQGAIQFERDRVLCSEMTGVTQTMEHKIPLSKNGEHHPDNWGMAPGPWNSSKAAKLNWTPPENTFGNVEVEF